MWLSFPVCRGCFLEVNVGYSLKIESFKLLLASPAVVFWLCRPSRQQKNWCIIHVTPFSCCTHLAPVQAGEKKKVGRLKYSFCATWIVLCNKSRVMNPSQSNISWDPQKYTQLWLSSPITLYISKEKWVKYTTCKTARFYIFL